MTDYVLWDAGYGREASKRYKTPDALRKAVRQTIISYGQGNRPVRYELCSLNYNSYKKQQNADFMDLYKWRGALYAIGKTVYYRTKDKTSVVLPSGKLQ